MPKQIRLTEAQFAVIEALWRNGPQSIRELTAQIYPAQTTSDYATVQKLLNQLEEKGCASRNRSQLAHVFQATIVREDVIDSQLQELADKLCGGSIAPVLMRLVEASKLSARERDALRKLLDEPRISKRNKRDK
jgi:BlaI family penicillinase repressor